MTKIITTIVLAIFLTACTSQENGEEKTFNTDKKAEVVPQTLKSTQSTELNESKETVQSPAVSYAKNIFELEDVDGNKLHVDEAENGIIFQEHKDKVVFLLFFGYRCPPCLTEIPAIKEMVNEKGDKLAVIGMEVQRLPEEQLKIFKESKKLNYAVLSGEHTDNSNFISYIAQRAQWSGSIPFLVGIKPNGEVGVVHVGGMRKSDFEKVFDELSN
ncbi:MAG: Thioredoxin [uncultured Sulfurovum sp.]|uniref:Thioredoxin n=1 Tax=uncultured Sulfurovum sp. TaxID=269237 RepID=A0A6S6S891_9BACT|nr:MAG: Thioredoxin [uncultured Sulfurovum sp.]